jgi:hypothetical protein
MSYYRFKIDQIVVPSATSLPFGFYTILRLLPLVNGEPRYRIRGARDRLERAVLQNEIRVPTRNDAAFVRQPSAIPAAENERPNGADNRPSGGPRRGAGDGGNDADDGQSLPAHLG